MFMTHITIILNKLGNDYLNGELLQHTFEAFEVQIN